MPENLRTAVQEIKNAEDEIDLEGAPDALALLLCCHSGGLERAELEADLGWCGEFASALRSVDVSSAKEFAPEWRRALQLLGSEIPKVIRTQLAPHSAKEGALARLALAVGIRRAGASLTVERKGLRCRATRVTREIEIGLAGHRETQDAEARQGRALFNVIVLADLFEPFASTRALAWHLQRWMNRGLRGVVTIARGSRRPVVLTRADLALLAQLCRESSPDHRGGRRPGARCRVGRKPGQRWRVTDEKALQVAALRAAGKSVTAISETVGLSRTTVYRLLG